MASPKSELIKTAAVYLKEFFANLRGINKHLDEIAKVRSARATEYTTGESLYAAHNKGGAEARRDVFDNYFAHEAPNQITYAETQLREARQNLANARRELQGANVSSETLNVLNKTADIAEGKLLRAEMNILRKKVELIEEKLIRYDRTHQFVPSGIERAAIIAERDAVLDRVGKVHAEMERKSRLIMGGSPLYVPEEKADYFLVSLEEDWENTRDEDIEKGLVQTSRPGPTFAYGEDNQSRAFHLINQELDVEDERFTPDTLKSRASGNVWTAAAGEEEQSIPSLVSQDRNVSNPDDPIEEGDPTFRTEPEAAQWPKP